MVFHKLKNYESYLIMQAQFYNINKKLIFINSFQFLRSSLDSLVKNLGKYDFKHLSQEFDRKVLDLVKLLDKFS